MHAWLLFVYKVPTKPTSNRVYVWRKLKKLGAILHHDAVWVLPSNTHTLEQFQWLAAEIKELKGEATLWESKLALSWQEEAVIQQFLSQVEPLYEEILSELEQEDADLTLLSKRYQQVRLQDYFQSDLGKIVRIKLLGARGGDSE
ncbi:ChrB protein [Paenibacillus filicis]|uniref:ChrB protein n=1 Tax=Paenibacillus gyeongsangnamensis TaxID=3388067 RepID=A0ABT4QDZ0_9BACL|nr:Chromate resistance protein ChrB [Paenibacillus filicis]MCZ8515069.1 ChrB protein [Paenibacillus filicis]